MIKLKVHIIYSGSDGNSTILTDTSNNQLILDCGLQYTEIINNCDLNKVDGVLTTHAHLDHSKSLPMFEKFCIPTYTWRNIDDGILVELENWKIVPMKLVHNVKCFGFLIYSKIDNKMILYITDTNYIPEHIPLEKIDCWIQDTNYDEEIVAEKTENGEFVNPGHQWHCSTQQIEDYIARHQCKPKLFIAYHLSNSGLNDIKRIESRLAPITQKLVIARPNTIVEF